MVFAFSTLDFWRTPWRYSMGRMGLYVKGVFRAVAHATLRLLFFALRCFALHALRSARCVCFACPRCVARCVAGCEGFDNAGDKVEHGAIP